MPIDIQKVLICDAVDQSCVELLKSNGIHVDYKLKLAKDVLIVEAKVKKKEIKRVTQLKISETCQFASYSSSHALKNSYQI